MILFAFCPTPFVSAVRRPVCISATLDSKNLETVTRAIMDELNQLGKQSPSAEELERAKVHIESQHIYARETTKILINAKNKHLNGDKDMVNTISTQLNKLVEFYPKHIAKEDENFFIPCMEYFTRKEQDDMLNEFWEFDKKLIHEKYRKIIELYE